MQQKMLLLAVTPLLALATAVHGGDSLPAISANASAQATTVCAIKNANEDRAREAQLVAITAVAIYDFEYGYYLTEPQCSDRLDGTGRLKITFPAATHAEGFPALEKLASQSFLAENRGKRAFCTCIGWLSYLEGYPQFVLSSAVVWAED